MKIGFDFDKVFVDYPPFIPSFVIDKLYKKKNHKLIYRFPGEAEQKIRILSHYWFFRAPIKKNIEALSKIAKDGGHDIYLVSGRFGFLKNKTEIWLKRHNFKKFFKKIYFNFENEQPHFFKDRIIKKLGINKYIDDDLDLILYLAKKNPKATFFWLSKDSDETITLPKNIKQIKDLKELNSKHLKL